jgi:hypothetical protein
LAGYSARTASGMLSDILFAEGYGHEPEDEPRCSRGSGMIERSTQTESLTSPPAICMRSHLAAFLDHEAAVAVRARGDLVRDDQGHINRVSRASVAPAPETAFP